MRIYLTFRHNVILRNHLKALDDLPSCRLAPFPTQEVTTGTDIHAVSLTWSAVAQFLLNRNFHAQNT